jgi:hypothetical protein
MGGLWLWILPSRTALRAAQGRSREVCDSIASPFSERGHSMGTDKKDTGAEGTAAA